MKGRVQTDCRSGRGTVVSTGKVASWVGVCNCEYLSTVMLVGFEASTASIHYLQKQVICKKSCL